MLRHASLNQPQPLQSMEESMNGEVQMISSNDRYNNEVNKPQNTSLSQSSNNHSRQNSNQFNRTDQEYYQDNSDDEETYVYEDHELTEIPLSVAESIFKRRQLRKLSLKGNMLSTVPSLIGNLSSLYYLNLSHNSFHKVPDCIRELQNLEILDMSHNLLTGLPDFLTDLPNLIGLSLKSNRIAVLPTIIADLKSLEILELEENPLELPEDLHVGDGVDEETWIIALRSYISSKRAELNALSANVAQSMDASGSEPRTSSAERSRSTSESGISLRQIKRMGFVMSRNASDQSYVTSLHARGLSHDVHMLDSATSAPPPPMPSTAPHNNVPLNGESYLYQRETNSPTSTDLADLPTPRSPVVRSPYEGTWGSPRPSVTEAEPQSSVSSRLSTLAEEHDADANTGDTDLDSPIVGPAFRTISNTMPQQAATKDPLNLEYRNSPISSPLFKEGYQENFSEQNGNFVFEIPKKSGNATSPQRQGYDIADSQKSTREGFNLDPAFEKIEFSLTTLGDYLARIPLPSSLAAVVSEAQDHISKESWYLALSKFSDLLEKLTSHSIFQSIILRLNKRQQREFAGVVMQGFPELEAAWRLFQQARLAPLNADVSSFQNQQRIQDEQLHSQLNFATKHAQMVLNLLNGVVSKSAAAAADTSEPPMTAMADRIRDLSGVCIRCSGATRTVRKLLERHSNTQSRPLQIPERRRFWDEVNSFLKAVIAILSAVKAALPDVPLLADAHVNSEVSSLTRVVKEIPPLLEQSSYRLLLDVPGQLLADENETGNSISSTDLINGPGILPPPTPLTATIGPAAQVLVSPGEHYERPNEGYIQYGLRTRTNE